MKPRRPFAARPVWRYLAPMALLLLMFAQVLGGINANSLTIDEGLHITSGYTILRTGDYRLIEEHPPLVKMIAAWPLLLVPDLPDPRTLSGWGLDVELTDSVRLVRVTQALIYPYQPLDRLVFAARLPIALLALILGAMAYRWAADWFGTRGGSVALFLLAFDPNIVAHAGLAATDLGTACFILIALYTFQRLLHRPSLGRWSVAGLTLGLALGTKMSALLLLPAQGLLVLLYGLSRPGTPSPGGRWRHALRWVAGYAALLLLAGLVLWGLYGFKVGPVPGAGITLPAPDHAIPWLRLRQHMQEGHAAFLMGQVSHQGWWFYFPIALALKTPLPILFSWLATLVALITGRRRAVREELALWLFPVLYIGFSLTSSLNIGYRHLLPILPLLAVAAGRLAAFFPDRAREWKLRGGRALWSWIGVGLALWLVVGTLSLHPYELAYFNELAGGPDGGYRYLVDSNTDWGQGLKALARYQEEQEVAPVHLSMFTFLDPAIYGVDYWPLTPMHGDTPAVFPSRFSPPPGDYVISTTTLQGIPLVDPEMYDWFRHREPDGRIAHVMFHYRVPPPEGPQSWVAQCLDPVAPLPPPVINEGFGRDDLRRAYFDCRGSWLIPGGGSSSGWYVLPQAALSGDDGFVRHHLAPYPLSFRQTHQGALPPFAIYEAQRPSLEPGPVTSQNIRVGDLSFLGYTIPADLRNGSLEVWTYWRVEALPDRPASLMLHLVGPGGTPVAVGDGLGVPVEIWQVGDVMLQRHRLELPPGSPGGEYALYTGAYWLGDLERWPVQEAGRPTADQITLPPLHIEP